MNLLPQDPKMRQRVLVIVLVAVLLFGAVFLYLTYFAPGTPSGNSAAGVSGGISEITVKQLDSDISSLRDELNSEFYKSLQPHSWERDTAVSGKRDPFVP